MPAPIPDAQVVVIGGGQAGLAAGYFLRRAGRDVVILDDQPAPGGAWRHSWPSLRLFSPAEYSSLPGWRMPPTGGPNPDAAHVTDYLSRYERRYDLRAHRPVRVERVRRVAGEFAVDTDLGPWRARAVVSATGTWTRPFVPRYPGQGQFRGRQIHSARYAGPARYAGARVLVVGAGNSGAQIAADLVGQAQVTWCTPGPPRYMPDDVDGRELFRVANAAIRHGDQAGGIGGLGDIVVVPPVKAARDAGLLVATPMFRSFTATGVAWDDGARADVDAVVWCTGFRPALGHLRGLRLPRRQGRILTRGPVVPSEPGLFLLGYGDWTGPASATLIGVGQWARATASAIEDHLASPA